MAKTKTFKTEVDVKDFIEALADEQKRADSSKLVEVMTEVTGLAPYMWGPSIVGFGNYHYKYESGREGDAPLAAFSPRKAAITLYLAGQFPQREELLTGLGKHKASGGCVYVKKLSDIDLSILKEDDHRLRGGNQEAVSSLIARLGKASRQKFYIVSMFPKRTGGERKSCMEQGIACLRLLLITAMIFLTATSMAQGTGQADNTTNNGQVRNIICGNFFTGGIKIFGLGLGIDYEYLLGQKGKFSFHVPLSYVASSERQPDPSTGGEEYHKYQTFFIAPGFRFHPAGAFRPTDFSIGVQFAIGPVLAQDKYYDSNSAEQTDVLSVLSAPMMNISVSHTFKNGFLCGLFIAGGSAITGHYGNKVPAGTNLAFFQIGMRVGGKW